MIHLSYDLSIHRGRVASCAVCQRDHRERLERIRWSAEMRGRGHRLPTYEPRPLWDRASLALVEAIERLVRRLLGKR